MDRGLIEQVMFTKGEITPDFIVNAAKVLSKDELNKMLLDSYVTGTANKLFFYTTQPDLEDFTADDDVIDAITNAFSVEADNLNVVTPNGDVLIFNITDFLSSLDVYDVIEMLIAKYSTECKERELFLYARDCEECYDKINEMDIDELLEKVIENCLHIISVSCEKPVGCSEELNECYSETMCEFDVDITEFISKEEIIDYWKNRAIKEKFGKLN